MDTFTTMVGVTTLFFIWMGERFRTGAYLILGAMFAILFAWRMAEEVFYMATAALIFVVIFRAFFAKDDVRDEFSESDNE